MMEIGATYVVASRPPEWQPTAMATACANFSSLEFYMAVRGTVALL